MNKANRKEFYKSPEVEVCMACMQSVICGSATFTHPGTIEPGNNPWGEDPGW